MFQGKVVLMLCNTSNFGYNVDIFCSEVHIDEKKVYKMLIHTRTCYIMLSGDLNCNLFSK